MNNNTILHINLPYGLLKFSQTGNKKIILTDDQNHTWQKILFDENKKPRNFSEIQIWNNTSYGLAYVSMEHHKTVYHYARERKEIYHRYEIYLGDIKNVHYHDESYAAAITG